MLPPPVCVNPSRLGVTWPCRAPKLMVTAGLAAGWARTGGNAKSKLTRLIMRRFMATDSSPRSPTQNQVRGSGEQAVFVLEWTGINVVVVANFRTKDDVFARPKRDAGRRGDVKTLKVGTLPLSVVKK